tara:strand:+ start:298 stop:447 length:150 start_codon:yes stop_codon:yes gene_type:complete
MKQLFKFIALINKTFLPSLTKKRVDPARASKFQLMLLGWRYFITKNSLN